MCKHGQERHGDRLMDAAIQASGNVPALERERHGPNRFNASAIATG